MPLEDPVAPYNAANNMEAHFVRDALLAAGIEAHAVEDVSQVGSWLGGLVPEIHKPQVFVARVDLQKAQAVLEDFESRADRRRSDQGDSPSGQQIEAVCEECGYRASFPASLQGSVQECPKCAAYVDVGEEGLPEDWGGEEDEEEHEPAEPSTDEE